MILATDQGDIANSSTAYRVLYWRMETHGGKPRKVRYVTWVDSKEAADEEARRIKQSGFKVESILRFKKFDEKE